MPCIFVTSLRRHKAAELPRWLCTTEDLFPVNEAASNIPSNRLVIAYIFQKAPAGLVKN